ncbi:hypothetical protein ASJ35_15285 [Ruthenibacterium lactatiformans]|uniref:Uncharacterized protein n=1 Tax=Ruthenibacterium lactatiformans TaxID=1550024 RepID=A0A0W7TMR7_9FIRM|nr:hypothetical protein ASJ35_15285 [Ruthenibacterium lactatiformans]
MEKPEVPVRYFEGDLQDQKKLNPMQARLRKTGGARDENARWAAAEKRMLSAVPRTGRFCFFRIHRRTASYR